jgi:hypothetical protein
LRMRVAGNKSSSKILKFAKILITAVITYLI